jgi:hypothetical protein
MKRQKIHPRKLANESITIIIFRIYKIKRCKDHEENEEGKIKFDLAEDRNKIEHKKG